MARPAERREAIKHLTADSAALILQRWWKSVQVRRKWKGYRVCFSLIY